MKTIHHLFDDYSEAQSAVRELESSDTPSANISMVASNAEGRYRSGALPPDTEMARGATVGAVVAGGAGLLAALGAFAIPGLGPLVAAGVLATTRTDDRNIGVRKQEVARLTNRREQELSTFQA